MGYRGNSICLRNSGRKLLAVTDCVVKLPFSIGTE